MNILVANCTKQYPKGELISPAWYIVCNHCQACILDMEKHYECDHGWGQCKS